MEGLGDLRATLLKPTLQRALDAATALERLKGGKCLKASEGLELLESLERLELSENG